MQLLILILMVLFSFGIVDRRAAADDWQINPPDPLKPIEMVLVRDGCYKMGDSSATVPKMRGRYMRSA
jgi:hypothetical protein